MKAIQSRDFSEKATFPQLLKIFHHKKQPMPKIDLGPTDFNAISFINENLIFQSDAELNMHSKMF